MASHNKRGSRTNFNTLSAITGRKQRGKVRPVTPGIIKRAVAESQGDEFLKGNMCWEEIIETSRQCSVMLRTHAAHSVMLRRPEFVSRLTNRKQFAICIQALTRHLGMLRDELQAIYELHKDFRGGARSHDDIRQSVDIYNLYVGFQDRHDSIVLPTSMLLGEMVGEVEDILTAEGLRPLVDEYHIAVNDFIHNGPPKPALAPEQDPSVITDVKTK